MGTELLEEQDSDGYQEGTVAADLNAVWDKVAGTEDDSAGEGEPDTAGEGETDTVPDTESGLEKEEDTPSEKDTPVSEKVPAGLSPALREDWKKAPQAVKDWALKRETEFSVGLQKNAEWAQRAQQMDAVLQPYMPYIQMNGGAQIIPQVLATAMQLAMGPPAAKVEAAIDILMNNGVDIDMLDQRLTARLGGEAPQQSQPQLSEREQRIEQFIQQQEWQERQQYQQAQEQVMSGVMEFLKDPKNEFAEDVREDMGDLLEAAAKRGIAMTLEQAYDRACRLNDDINKIRMSREIPGKRRASSSIHGVPGGVPVRKGGSDDRRADIMAAMEGMDNR